MKAKWIFLAVLFVSPAMALADGPTKLTYNTITYQLPSANGWDSHSELASVLSVQSCIVFGRQTVEGLLKTDPTVANLGPVKTRINIKAQQPLAGTVAKTSPEAPYAKFEVSEQNEIVLDIHLNIDLDKNGAKEGCPAPLVKADELAKGYKNAVATVQLKKDADLAAKANAAKVAKQDSLSKVLKAQFDSDLKAGEMDLSKFLESQKAQNSQPKTVPDSTYKLLPDGSIIKVEVVK